ncbi:MAG: efflux transporter outer membrane subunit [Desulfurivibrio sp.]|nr:efflux transporter outer membrane subunit [Desulfurivibrio sp.]MBU4034732.1 efflux transporter outer membrane subunit [Pseudomonadota bacterium]MBU4117385.1 efflux transporter outer membrane subunit [Pseudomonadota bacterium]
MGNVKTISSYILFVFILFSLLAGCAVGPDFKRPETLGVATYTATPMPEQTASAPTTLGESQRFVEGGWVNPQWWHELGSPKLNALINDALESSPTLAQSQAVLHQAQELYAAQAGSTLYPQVDADLGSQRQRSNPSTLGQTGDAREFSLYNAGVGVRYNLDLAGGTRRALEALAANVDYQRYQLEGARLTLAANIVTTAVTQARLAAQIQATEAILASQVEQLNLTQERVRLGHAAPDEVLALQTPVEQTRAGIPLLRNQLQQNDHLLAVLAGQAPGAKVLPLFSLREFTLPTDLPLIVPSELVRTRPDIQAAEAILHSANAEYGVAIAKLYPQLNLSANLGSQALTTGALFGSGSAIWSLVGQLTQPLFNLGLPAEKRAALAAFDAAAANYRNVVLEALRNVADVLRALENDAQRLTALSAADAAAQGSLESMQRQYALGAASYVQLLIAQQQSQQTRINLIEAQARRLVDSAALYQAMGGERKSDG